MTKFEKTYLGRSLIKKLKRSRQINRSQWLNENEFCVGNSDQQVNLKSLTEENDLQRLLAKAENDGNEYENTKEIKFVNDTIEPGIEEKKIIYLRIPRRPKWLPSHTPKEFRDLESESFLDWRRTIAQLQDDPQTQKRNLQNNALDFTDKINKMIITPFEKNLEVWKQLWRVIERSDILVQIVDARNPLFYRNEDLESYVKESHPRLYNKIIKNKTHLTKPHKITRKPMKNTSKHSNLDQDTTETTQPLKSSNEKIDPSLDDDNLSEIIEDDDSSEGTWEDESDTESYSDAPDSDSLDDSHQSDHQQHLPDTSRCDNTDDVAMSDLKSHQSLQKSHEVTNSLDINEYSNMIPYKLNLLLLNKSDFLSTEQRSSWATYLTRYIDIIHDDGTDIVRNESGFKMVDKGILNSSYSLRTQFSEAVWKSGQTLVMFFSAKSIEDEANDVFSPREFLELIAVIKIYRDYILQTITRENEFLSEKTNVLESMNEKPRKAEKRVINVGFVGYPNVGKSSTINALLGLKKVAVSATPGKTKHFQTHFLLDSHVCLCDCPGLVMPSFVGSKAELIVNGVLPIDNITDPLGPTSLVARKVGIDGFHNLYGLALDETIFDKSSSNASLSQAILTAHSKSRGFSTMLGEPDFHKSCRIILKDYINGRLIYCEPPPDCDAQEFKRCNIKLAKIHHSNIGVITIDHKDEACRG
ncbi:large subunit GTPase 1 homolog isoform X2 [Gordionus sp. m RMFG-2023]|uniref:large subunit GTPase 1 homolog isoform X2 n=1 Tax=Gordionus sp. m RMFG-2023 TaxID=3053472 RepID=UPI0031FDB79B